MNVRKWIGFCRRVEWLKCHFFSCKSLWPINSKRRSTVLGGQEAPPCKSIKFRVTDTIGALETVNLSRSFMTEVSGDVGRRK